MEGFYPTLPLAEVGARRVYTERKHAHVSNVHWLSNMMSMYSSRQKLLSTVLQI